MSSCQSMNLNLANLPTDIIRNIIPGIKDPNQLYDSRTISPRWHALVEEHLNISNREFFPKIYSFRRCICSSGGITFRMRILQKHMNYFEVANWQIEKVALIDAISKDAYTDITYTVENINGYHFDKLARMFNRCSLIERLCLEANSPKDDAKIIENSLNDVSIFILKVEGVGFPSRNNVSTLLEVLESNTIECLLLPTCNITEMSNGIFVCQASRLVKIIELTLETAEVVSTWLLAVYKSSFEKARDKLNQSGQVTATFHSDPLLNGRTLLSIFVKQCRESVIK